MHPNRASHRTGEQEMLAFVAQLSFATVCVDGPAVVDAPLPVAGPERLLSRAPRSNASADKLDTARALGSVPGPDFCVSPELVSDARLGCADHAGMMRA